MGSEYKVVDYETLVRRCMSLASEPSRQCVQEIIAEIAEGTKEATVRMLDEFDAMGLHDQPSSAWSAMHAASALYPPRDKKGWRGYIGLALWLAAYLIIGINYPWLVIASLLVSAGYWVMNPFPAPAP